ncbi:MAG TPA: spore coat protein U domain-containing protein, partial [Pseudomonas sp.]|nr:spore coat protein U domain-containing protein [Pseudomonas sp.]
MSCLPRRAWSALICLPLWTPTLADTGVNDQVVSQSFELRAQVVPGCLLGAGSSDVTTFGSISFGQISTLNSNLDVVSTPGSGSIVVQCSPGTNFTLALNAGNHAS